MLGKLVVRVMPGMPGDAALGIALAQNQLFLGLLLERGTMNDRGGSDDPNHVVSWASVVVIVGSLGLGRLNLRRVRRENT
jgi:hypothetical protein